MSEPDVREIKLQPRYPESRQEDITDAYMRGYKSAVQVTDKLIARLNEENAELREQLQDAEHDESMAWDRVRKAESQNAKLHELVGDLREYIAGNANACEFCSQVGTCENHPAPPQCKYELTGENHAVLDFIADCLSELGVEQ